MAKIEFFNAMESFGLYIEVFLSHTKNTWLKMAKRYNYTLNYTAKALKAWKVNGNISLTARQHQVILILFNFIYFFILFLYSISYT